MTVDGATDLATRTDESWLDLVSEANIPALLMLVYQFSGDPRWLEAPYLPARTAGMDENDDGGLEEWVQDEIRVAAGEALGAIAAGVTPRVERPAVADLGRMMSVCMGEPVTEEYCHLLSREWPNVVGPTGIVSVERAVRTPPVDTAPKHVTVALIGAGVSSLTASVRFAQSGIEHVLFEKSGQVGGVWRDNDYPGCGVDTPSHLYSHSYYPFDWSQYFAKRDEVFDYLCRFADDLGVTPRIRFRSRVEAMVWDEARSLWRLKVISAESGSTEWTADVVVSATGQLNVPKVPDLPGMDDFSGQLFHSADWPADLDVTGLRVAVVGSGASAMQIVPKIVDAASSVTVFQRSPQWVAENPVYFKQISESTRQLLQASPLYRFWYRARLVWTFNDKVHPSLRRDPAWTRSDSVNEVNDGHRRLYERYLRQELDGREDLIAKALPDYPPFGKRMLLDNGWFKALRADNVELVAEGVRAFDDRHVITQGDDRREVDVVVLATGFDTLGILQPISVLGRDGVDLHEHWGADDARAYLGMTVPGFPNLFIMCGPNTNLGHGGGWIQVAELQADYIGRAVETLLSSTSQVMECRDEVEADYTAQVDAAHAEMIWTHPGMRNWYRNDAGRVVTNTPWRIGAYSAMLSKEDASAFTWSER